MKISVFTLLYTLVVFLDSVQSIGPILPRPHGEIERVLAHPRRRIVLKVGDIVVRNEFWAGRYHKTGQVGMFIRVDAASLEPEKWMGENVVITREEFQPGDDLIRNKFWLGTWHEDAFYEIHEDERRQVYP